MKLFKKMKDGGPESTVTGYWLIELKWLFSIVLLRFEGKSREAYHNHAFNCYNWLLKGKLVENLKDGRVRTYTPSFKGFKITREDFHKVDSSYQTSWLISFRGPWSKQWKEYHPQTDNVVTLESGRVIVDTIPNSNH